MLLGVRRFFGVPDGETLETMLAESAKHQQEVTDQLGYQVRRAVELLIHSLNHADQKYERELLAKVPEAELYESALTVMMRLVFLFCAEERGLLLLGDQMYDQNYAVSTLVAQLQEAADQHGEEVLERRQDAWVRLLSTFRAVYGGIEHERMKLPAYGGNLFNPDRFPFLEGRAVETKWRETVAAPLPVNNRTVLHLLRSLQYLEMQGEARRLSFRALDIEQIGHVYEGLLDHTARRAAEPVLGLVGSKGDEPEIALSELERQHKRGEAELLAFLNEQTGKSENTLRRLLAAELEPRAIDRLRAACGNDEALLKRVRPIAALIRPDSFDRPVVIPQGSVYVTAGTDRRSSGTHYTPRSLTEPIVQYTLEPLVYIGPAEGKPKSDWQLRSPRELLDLKICDMTCGSGAFLVQACRYLSELLVEAWENLGTHRFQRAVVASEPGGIHGAPGERPHARGDAYPGITPFGEPATGAAGESLIPAEAEERMAYARRIVAQRCLYGVDKNPLAVEMAKLSLWLLTLAKAKPFTFLDHAIRRGDSLVGIHHPDQLRYFNLKTEGAQQLRFSGSVTALLDDVIALRRRIEASPANTVAEVEVQEALLGEAEEKIARLRHAADLLISVGFQGSSAKAMEDLHGTMAMKANFYVENGTLAEFKEAVHQVLHGQPTFHWPLEFPEVFNVQRTVSPLTAPADRAVASESAFGESHPQTDSLRYNGGFDAFVCNPPFIGGQKITGNLGVSYRNFLVDQLANGKKGSADLCAYFFLQAKRLLRAGGGFGMLATNTIAQGDTREVGLDQIAASGGVIYRALPSRPWPGVASLGVAEVWLRNDGEWHGECVLEEQPVAGITPFLTKPGRTTGKPYRLVANADKSFQGSIVLGMGFVLTPEEAQALITKDARNRDVIYPYLNGEDLNSSHNLFPARWVIYFEDWPLERVGKNEWNVADEKQRDAWVNLGRVSPSFVGPVAADYADCLQIIRTKVKPERDRLANGDATARDRAKRWWQFGRPTMKLYKALEHLERVLARSQVSKTQMSLFVEKGMVYDQRLVVFALDSYSAFGVLDSFLHYSWAMEFGSTLRTDATYTPTMCFETFPFPGETNILEKIGQQYYEYRQSIMLARQEGLTKTYNRFHNPEESSADIGRLRELHQEMDEAVAQAYGWTDLRLGHDFHETKQGVRFTINEAARREVLDRLLELNHRRYAEEVAEGLHDKGAKKNAKSQTPRKSGRTARAAKSAATPSLFGEDDDEAEAATSRPQAAARTASASPVTERPTPIAELETNEVMAAFRRATRDRGWMERDELLKEVSLELGYERLRAPTEEALRGHLRTAVRRGIIATDGPELVALAARTMEDYTLEERREVFASVMRLGRRHEREEIIRAVAEHLGFGKLTETVRQSVKSAINSGIRQGILEYEGDLIWRE